MFRRAVCLLLIIVCFAFDLTPTLAQKRGAAPKRKTPAKKTPAQAARDKQRARSVHRAVTATAGLKPLAAKLLDARTPENFRAVESYARSHPGPTGALAWLAAGYAHLDEDEFAEAITDLLKARGKSGELNEYADFFLAQAYDRDQQPEQVSTVLKSFSATYKDSLFADDARLLLASADIANGVPQTAITVLRSMGSPAARLLLANAYIAAGRNADAIPVLTDLYYRQPLTAQADAAGVLLKQTPAVPVPAFAERISRARALLEGRRSSQAADELRSLIESAPSDELSRLRLDLGIALYRAGKRSDSAEVLKSIEGLAGEDEARRVYYLLEIARGNGDAAEVARLLADLRQKAPTSEWLQEALLTAANMYMLQRSYAESIPIYTELATRFPQGKRAPYSNWKAAWLAYRLGNLADAKKGFQHQIDAYPAGSEVPAAVYWLGRIAEREKNLDAARGYYRFETERFRNYYYADLARLRLKELGPEKTSYDPVMARISPAPPDRRDIDVTVPADNVRAQKARLLANAALYEFAARELQAASSEQKGTWAIAEIAHMFEDAGTYHRALQSLKRALPGYYASDIDHLPRALWEGLFPRPYWNDLRTRSEENGLEPYLVASLIRQESEFNPKANSRADARGLMQLLPVTGRQLARELRVRRYSTPRLYEPAVNLQLGTRYLRSMIDRYGAIEYALAAYNAGANRVEVWKQEQYADMPEFVESIPFTETREYVQAILRNKSVYEKLYGNQ